MLDFSNLEKIIIGFSGPHFHAKYFEKEPLFLQGGLNSGSYGNLFNAEIIRSILVFGNIHVSEIEVIKHKGVCSVPHLYTPRGHVKLGVLHELFEADHHFRLLGVQRRDQMTNELSVILSQSFMCSVPVNAYISPAASQGFCPHYDCHDVLVVQTVGCKHWTVYASDLGTPELPLPEQQFVRERDEHRHGDIVAQFTLKEGDVLYLPRGTFHSASTTSVASAHLTFGIRPPTWSAIINSALNELYQSDPEFRKFPVPCGTDELTDHIVERMKRAIFRHMDRERLASSLARCTHADLVMKQKKEILPWFSAGKIDPALNE